MLSVLAAIIQTSRITALFDEMGFYVMDEAMQMRVTVRIRYLKRWMTGIPM